MKFLLPFFMLFAFSAFSQPGSLKTQKADSCYKRGDQASKKRFAEWECGKLAGVVDCNEKLELDPQSNTVLVASSHQPFTGTCETCHMNGLHERTVRFVNGKTEGMDTTTYKSSCPMAIRMHVSGVQHGQWTYFYDSIARPAWVMNYNMGNLHGEQIYFNKKGDTTKYEYYIDGVLNGKKLLFANGKRLQAATYKNGLLDGQFLAYNKDGIIIEELSYKDGMKDGVLKYYYDDGKLLSTENWEKNARNGEFKTFYYDQTLQKLETWKKASGKSQEYISAVIYEFNDKETAYNVGGLLAKKRTAAQVKEELGDVEYTSSTVTQVNQDEHEILEGQKLEKGFNEPFKSGKKYYMVQVTEKNVLTKKDVREGWFEERYPDQKVKRRALYKKDVIIEEHVYDENGRETYTFGGQPNGGAEDDAIPTGDKKKKPKKEEVKPPVSGE